MEARKSLQSQLANLKLRFIFFGRAEAKELVRVLRDGEVVKHCVHGYYHGGSGLLVATNQRLFLIDKRPYYLNVEEAEYDRIQMIEVVQKIFQATLTFQSRENSLTFRSVSDARLKALKRYVDGRINEPQMIEEALRRIDADMSYRPYINSGSKKRYRRELPRSNVRKFNRHMKSY